MCFFFFFLSFQIFKIFISQFFLKKLMGCFSSKPRIHASYSDHSNKQESNEELLKRYNELLNEKLLPLLSQIQEKIYNEKQKIEINVVLEIFENFLKEITSNYINIVREKIENSDVHQSLIKEFERVALEKKIEFSKILDQHLNNLLNTVQEMENNLEKN